MKTKVKIRSELIEWVAGLNEPWTYTVDVLLDQGGNQFMSWKLDQDVIQWLQDHGIGHTDIRVTWMPLAKPDTHNGLCLELPDEHAMMFKLAWGGE